LKTKRDARDVGCHLFEHFQHLAGDRQLAKCKSCYVAAGPRKVRNDALLDRIHEAGEYDGNGPGLLLQHRHRPPARDQDHVRLPVTAASARTRSMSSALRGG
jgi:hypothetical protein